MAQKSPDKKPVQISIQSDSRPSVAPKAETSIKSGVENKPKLPMTPALGAIAEKLSGSASPGPAGSAASRGWKNVLAASTLSVAGSKTRAKDMPAGSRSFNLLNTIKTKLKAEGKDENNLVQYGKDIVKLNQLQNLLHDALIATNHVHQCAIIRRTDNSLRATSSGFNLFPEQIQIFVDAFKNPAQVREECLLFMDKRYECVRADRNSIYAKLKNSGVILVRTSTLLLVATYIDGMYPSVCVEAVEKLADYFKEKGK